MRRPITTRSGRLVRPVDSHRSVLGTTLYSTDEDDVSYEPTSASSEDDSDTEYVSSSSSEEDEETMIEMDEDDPIVNFDTLTDDAATEDDETDDSDSDSCDL